MNKFNGYQLEFFVKSLYLESCFEYMQWCFKKLIPDRSDTKTFSYVDSFSSKNHRVSFDQNWTFLVVFLCEFRHNLMKNFSENTNPF